MSTLTPSEVFFSSLQFSKIQIWELWKNKSRHSWIFKKCWGIGIPTNKNCYSASSKAHLKDISTNVYTLLQAHHFDEQHEEQQIVEPRVEENNEDIAEDSLLLCNYCPKRCDDLQSMKAHYIFRHPLFDVKYRVINRQEMMLKPQIRTSLYRCTYCTYDGLMQELQDHHNCEHTGMALLFYRFR